MKVRVIMGSVSDKPVYEKVKKQLEYFGVAHEVRALSAHRTSEELEKYISSFDKEGVQVVIAIAGKSAHLAGVIAAKVTLPVIAVPVKTSFMGGMDSLLSIVQMPKGVPVATVGVDAGENAAILAVQILALSDESLRNKLMDHKEEMKKEALEKEKEL